MIRTQIQLTKELADQVKELARMEHISMAETIRMALVSFLKSGPHAGSGDRYVRALAVAGRFRSGHPDLSAEHDGEFAEAVHP